MVNSEAISGEVVVQDVMDWIRRAFNKPARDFHACIEIGSPVGHASSRISNGRISVTVSKDLIQTEISDIKLFTLVVFTICHEVAHCLGGHLKNHDKNSKDTRSLEAHADYIGARLVSWYFDGLPVNKKISNLSFYKDFLKDPFNQIADACLFIKEQIFDREGMGRYPSNNYRLTLVIGGFSSYLKRIGVLNHDIQLLFARVIAKSGIDSVEKFSSMLNSNNNIDIQTNLKILADCGLTEKAVNIASIKPEYWFLFATNEQILHINENADRSNFSNS